MNSAGSDLTLGGNLADPMEPLDVKLEADLLWEEGHRLSPLPWQEDYRLEYVIPGSRFVYANVMRCVGSKPEPWSACCQIAGAPMFKGWHATAEAARAAVENHIAAHIEDNLSGES